MMWMIKPVTEVITSLQRLPGIGPRSAERLTYFLLRMPESEVSRLADALKELKTKTFTCEECFNVSEDKFCPICLDSGRDRGVLLIVEEPLDVIALEKTAKFKGIYHVLGGVIDPVSGIGPEELRIRELLDRISQLTGSKEGVLEIILATNPSTEGETTAIYLKKILTEQYSPEKIRLTRIARGLPVGGDLEYADPLTLSRALEDRVNY